MGEWTDASLAEWEADQHCPPPKLCAECEIYYADPPSDLCPGCEAYHEHTQ